MELRVNKKPVVLIAGSVTTVSGYGARSRDIARSLIKSGKYDVRILPLRWGTTPQTALDANNPDDKIILERLIYGNVNFKPDYFIHITIPNEFMTLGNFNIGISAGIETTIPNPEWIVGCNKMDLVLLSSNHSVDVFKKAEFDKRDQHGNVLGKLKLTTPTYPLFEGVNLEVFNNKPDNSVSIVKYLDDIPDTFLFLFVGHWLNGDIGCDRKDVGMLVHTFIEAFKNKQRKNCPALVLKTSQAGFSITEYSSIYDKLQDIIAAIRSQGWSGNIPNIYVIEGQLSDEEMNALYNHQKVKAMVSFTKGEGFGRPLLEFAAVGKPIMASGWSGQLDFLDPEYSILLPGGINKVHPSATNEWIIPESEWFTVNYPIATKRWKDLFANYNDYKKKAKSYKSKVVKTFSLDKMADKLIDYIDNIDKYVTGWSNESTNVTSTPKMTKLKLPKIEPVTD
jgi:glycosyltransferase involved in cell wall biosynthesis